YYHYVTHSGSSVNRYRPERYLMEDNIARSFEQLMIEWGSEQKFGKLIAQEYFNSIYLETNNLVHADCPLTEEEKLTRLSSIWQRVGT
ncbi:MAG: hypothetical protein ACTHW2_12705, partial [Tissierella sp.]|uniref:hypothetical protein n=1 Tax=Tissierella sp. TaxID=41274 RepID=UPI003F975676